MIIRALIYTFFLTQMLTIVISININEPEDILKALRNAENLSQDTIKSVYDLIIGLANVATSDPYPLRTKDFAEEEYDYVIVGAGSAGSVVAARLSEDYGVKVIVLEAGGPETGFSLIPAAANLLWKSSDFVWNYIGEPQRNAANGQKENRIQIVAGKSIGGGSAHNKLGWSRGGPLDYDRWAQLGATNWSWSDVFPYFIKSERIQPENSLVQFDEGYHGFDGPITVTGASVMDTLAKAAYAGIRELGLPIGDYNGEAQDRFSLIPTSIENGVRQSTALKYLSPASERQNLDIVPFAHVLKVLIDEDKRAIGVLYEKNNTVYTVKATREVILCSGAYTTPKILMLSGIGPREVLEKYGLDVVKESPGVGQNLHDHPISRIHFLTHPNTTTIYSRDGDQLIKAAKQYKKDGSGPFGQNGVVQGFQRSEYALDGRPDVDFLFESLENSFTPLALAEYLGELKSEIVNRYLVPNDGKDGFSVSVINRRPLGRGFVTIKSSDPHENPMINIRMFENERDLIPIIEGMKMAVKIVESRAFQQTLGGQLFANSIPGCEELALKTDAYYECYARTFTGTISHACGTAKIGSEEDEMAVVDPQLKVRGVDGLRVIDASVIPEVPSGSLNAIVIMIGEKGADLIEGKFLKPLQPPLKGSADELEYIQLL
ncbi:L-sorbose 1-dehydrogenase-like [Brevipalpus obovatus]|uniref:L-sorbose 1-dehydrogenase-like n=1 Tax=Brevipalpus obovatus TaxID=246614 RepID=UPI003D9F7599